MHPPTTALLSALLNTTTTWMEVGTSFKEGLQFRPFSRPTTQSAQAQLILKESPFSSLSPMALVYEAQLQYYSTNQSSTTTQAYFLRLSLILI